MLKTPLKDVLRTTSTHIARLDDLGIKNVGDLLMYFPRTYNDRSDFTDIVDLRTDQVNTVKGFISHFNTQRTKYGKSITRGILTDDTGSVEVVWFNQPYIKRVMQNGDEVILMGKLKFAFGKVSLQSPSYELIKE
ncbi:hypothetical protein KKD70_03815 [Patescibacteria group bacterium]|nr:hypothetical protein [Patescibacteria group bacterium]